MDESLLGASRTSVNSQGEPRRSEIVSKDKLSKIRVMGSFHNNPRTDKPIAEDSVITISAIPDTLQKKNNLSFATPLTPQAADDLNRFYETMAAKLDHFQQAILQSSSYKLELTSKWVYFADLENLCHCIDSS